MTRHIYNKEAIFMFTKISLYTPSIDELDYRQTILMQPETMDYNKGYDINFVGYHKDTGCIEFPNDQWIKWYTFWNNNKPISYYAYIVRDIDRQFVGEVNLHYNSKFDWYDMGIVIEGKYRGLGYSKQAMKLLLIIAFEEYQAKAVHNDFETARDRAYKLHIDAGFTILNSHSNMIDLVLEKKNYSSIENRE